MATTLWGQKFYPDDPLEAEPPPMATPDPGVRSFRFKIEGDQGGVLGLLWAKENRRWKIVSYEAFEP